MSTAVAPPAATTVRPLQVAGFRRLAAGWSASNLGDSMLLLTLAIWAKDLTGSDGAAALVLAAFGLPALAAPVAGQLADRVSRRALVVAVDIVAAAGLLVLLAVREPDDVWLVYVVTFGYGCVGYLTSAAQSGLVRDLLPDDALAAGNGVLSTIDQTLRLLGPLAGAGLYVVLGPHALVVHTAGCFLLAAAVLSRMRVVEAAREAAARGRYWRDVTAGFRHLRSTPAVARLTLALAIAFGATGMTNATSFAAIEHGLGLGPEFMSVFASVQGIGSVVGGLTAALLIARLGEARVVATGLTLLALGVATTATKSLLLIVVGVTLVGLGVVWAVVASVTLRQRCTPPTLQGRAAAATNMVINVPQTTRTLLAASLVVLVDYRLLVVLTAVTVLAGAASCLPAGRPTAGLRRGRSTSGR